MPTKILYIAAFDWTFVKTDFEILKSKHEVEKYHYTPRKGFIDNTIEFFKQLIFLAFNLWRYDSVFIWFADYHSFLPVLLAGILNKKTFIVIGGYDVARISKLNYGVFTSKLRGFCASYSMNHCTLNLPVSEYVERKVKWIAKNSKTQLIYNCVNLPEYNKSKALKENLIITVGLIDSERTHFLKGIDTFIEVSKLLPDFNFLVIGVSNNLPEYLTKELPQNLELTERINHTDLADYYKKAKIYCQFSRSESFGISIVEAISYGCLPIVTNVGGMPELVQKYGHIVKRDPIVISNIIKKNIQLVGNFDKRKIVDKFSFENRKKGILKIDFS